MDLGMNLAGQQELQFRFDSITSDKGFMIKNMGDKGWGLFDLQLATMQYAITGQKSDIRAASKIYADTAVNDAFGNMLSEVTRDTTVKYVAVKKPEPAKDTTNPIMPVIVKPDLALKRAAAEISLPANPSLEKKNAGREVILYQKNSSVDSDTYIFLVPLGKGWDTVHAEVQRSEERLGAIGDRPNIISMEDALLTSEKAGKKESATIQSGNANKRNEAVASEEKRIEADEIKVQEPAMVTVYGGAARPGNSELMVPMVSDSVIVQKNASAVEGVVASGVSGRADCRRIADEEAFIRLRKKMAGKRTEEQMIEEAVRVLKQTCFSTLQIGQLSGIFVTDEMRYRFFESVFPHVLDPQSFSSLQRLLQDPSYKKKFESLKNRP
jgi:hypothetical protein